MATSFKNACAKLQAQKCTMITTLDEYLSEKSRTEYPEISFKCENNHIRTMKLSSFSNKKGDYCVECKDKPESKEKLKVIEKCKVLGFTFISYQAIHESRTVTFTCVCGNTTTVDVSGILRQDRTPTCAKCVQVKNRNEYNFVANQFKNAGCELLSSEYKARDEPLDYKCQCGAIAKICFRDFMAGKRCKENCKAEAYKKTCQEKFGCDNAAQNEIVKQKMRATTLKNHGVEHAMQNPEIQERAQNTNIERYGVKHAFRQQYVLEAIKKTNIKKYGCEQPLSNPDMRAKAHKAQPNVTPYVNKGFTWYVMGNEDDCLRDLLLFVKHTDICAGKTFADQIPIIYYNYPIKSKKNPTKINMLHFWTPDIWIPSKNRLIEVKSIHTYNLDPKRIKAKMLQCDKHNTELWIYKGKKLVQVIFVDHLLKSVDYLTNLCVLGDPIDETNLEERTPTQQQALIAKAHDMATNPL